MTRKQAKELLPIIQAFAEGKTIQERKLGTTDWIDTETPCFNSAWANLRIKPESRYRPFKSQEECWNEMHKHQPFGWLIDKDGDYLLPATVGDETDFISRFRVLKFADGTPFGIKEEE